MHAHVLAWSYNIPVQRNHHIQALRGVAASLVVLDHALEVIVERGILPAWFLPVGYSFGGLGVTTFFVISGFIMINISYDDFGSATNSLAFAKRRLIRIVPTYWIATLLAFALYTALPLSRHPSAVELAKSLLFIPYSSNPNEDMQPILGQGWTLNYEMFFYALFTVALLFRRRFALPALFAIFVGIVTDGGTLKSISDTAFPSTPFLFLAQPWILLFAIGMAIGVLKRELGDRLQLRHPFWIAVGMLLVQMVCHVIFRVPARVPFPIAMLVWIPPTLAVAACVFALPSARGSLFETISEAMGDASYSTYLFHLFVIVALKMVFPITTATAALFVISALLGANLFGIMFFGMVERPLTLAMRRTRPHVERGGSRAAIWMPWFRRQRVKSD